MKINVNCNSFIYSVLNWDIKCSDIFSLTPLRSINVRIQYRACASMKLITSYNFLNTISNSMKFPPPFCPLKNSPRLVIFINHFLDLELKLQLQKQIPSASGILVLGIRTSFPCNRTVWLWAFLRIYFSTSNPHFQKVLWTERDWGRSRTIKFIIKIWTILLERKRKGGGGGKGEGGRTCQDSKCSRPPEGNQTEASDLPDAAVNNTALIPVDF